MSVTATRQKLVRIVLAKPGLDGHDRGLKVVAMALRDAGAEIIYLGLRQSPEHIVVAARDEDADLIGLSILSGAHLALVQRVIDECDRAAMGDLGIVVGGTIPPRDVPALLSLGVRKVFPVGTPLDSVVAGTFEAAGVKLPAMAVRA